MLQYSATMRRRRMTVINASSNAHNASNASISRNFSWWRQAAEQGGMQWRSRGFLRAGM